MITINDTLYYSNNLIEDLVEIRRVLKDGGVLLIRDSNRIDYIIIWQYIKRLLGLNPLIKKKYFFASGMRDHLYFFNPRSLKKVLDTAGFRDVKFFNAALGNRTTDNNVSYIIASLMKYIFDIIWFSSARKFCLAPTIIVIARK